MKLFPDMDLSPAGKILPVMLDVPGDTEVAESRSKYNMGQVACGKSQL